ncbi:MAG: glycosyltransferase, partial [Candidatus Omnitrophica bacterium]|nr:glycosyltransferase [Candidatus Omnitrophota bacterium]
MIKNENIICISSIDWDFNWQGHQEIMSAFAKNGNRVLFLENTGVRAPGVRDIKRIKSRLKNWSKGVKGIRKIADNLYVLSPLLLPFPYMKIARWINRRLILSTLSKWISLTNFDDLIVWAFLPTPLSLDIIEDLPKKIVVYYCIDDLKSSSKTANKIEAYEIRLLKRADFVFVTSGALYEYSSSFNRNVYLFPFAVNFQQFEKARLDPEGACGITSGFKKPVIGYVGGINVKTDQALIRKMAQECPDYSFVFAGPLETDTSAFSGIKNVYLLGNQKHRDVPYLIKSFDVCVIPYVISEYTKSVYPAKLNEYHSMGKPVVSTALPEILSFNHKNDSLVFVGRNHKEFIDKIQKALDTVDNEELVKARIDSARANSWLKRIDDMSALLENKIRKDSDSGKDWMGSFSGFYRNLRVKFLRACFIAAGIYLFVFCTPLAWWLANPLVIADRPQKADCIVVFAGGVGESGRAGQGYEERVLYAAELYKKDYAKKILFS